MLNAPRPGDETARILDEYGDPQKICTYAIHETYRHFRAATAGHRDPDLLAAARRARRGELTAALAAYDTGKDPGEADTFTIRQARYYTTADPRVRQAGGTR